MVNKKIILTGTLVEFDKPNSNGHIYPKEVMIKAIREYNAKLKKIERKKKLKEINGKSNE